jgi:hypothetical protein
MQVPEHHARGPNVRSAVSRSNGIARTKIYVKGVGMWAAFTSGSAANRCPEPLPN